MPKPDSIAALLRGRLAAEPSMRRVALDLCLNLPPLWRFVKEGSDIGLSGAEQLMAHYNLVVVAEADARAAGIAFTRPTEKPNTIRAKARRERAEAKPAKKAKKKARP